MKEQDPEDAALVADVGDADASDTDASDTDASGTAGERASDAGVGESTRVESVGSAPNAAQKLAAALAGVDLTPETTSDERPAPHAPAPDPLLAELPPHHIPRS